MISLYPLLYVYIYLLHIYLYVYIYLYLCMHLPVSVWAVAVSRCLGVCCLGLGDLSAGLYLQLKGKSDVSNSYNGDGIVIMSVI